MADCLQKCLGGPAPAAPAVAVAAASATPAAPTKPEPAKPEPAKPEPAKAAPAAEPKKAVEPAVPAKEAAAPKMPSVSEDAVVDDSAEPAGATVESLPSLHEIDVMKPEAALRCLGIVTEKKNVDLGAACCMRVRVLCRDHPQREACERLGASRIIIAALTAMPDDPNLCLQGLAGLVNLCSGDSHGPRDTAVENGAIKAASEAVKRWNDTVEIAEMACLVIQNLCYGEDDKALKRRATADEHGAIEAVLAVIKKHETKEIMDTCVAAMRLTVDRMPKLREKAKSLGATDDWVKPITKEGGGSLLSFRGGFGTSRRKAKAAALQSNH